MASMKIDGYTTHAIFRNYSAALCQWVSRMHVFANRNTKRSVYCLYGQYSLTFRALALRQRETERKRNHFIFCLSLTKGQCSKRQTITIRIGSTPTFLYFHLYLYSAYAAHYVYFGVCSSVVRLWSCKFKALKLHFSKLVLVGSSKDHYL